MGKFLDFINESTKPLIMEFNKTTVDLNDEKTVITINSSISQAMDDEFLTPYMAIGRIMNILSQYSLHLPKMFLDDESGVEYVELLQFGLEPNDELKNFLYFEYVMNENGYFDIFCQIVDGDELDELLDDEEEDSLD